MIKLGPARARLAEIIEAGITDGAVPTATVQRAGIDSLAVFPTVIIGQPNWEPQERLTYAIDRSTFPIACVVTRGVGGDTPAIDELEEIWSAIVQLLKTTSEQDQTLGGVCAQSMIARADFGSFTIQGQTYPAQLISVDLYG